MVIKLGKKCSIWQGDARNSFAPQAFYAVQSSAELLKQPQLKAASNLRLRALITLQQTHSVQGYVLTDEKTCYNYRPYQWEGDYLVTTIPRVGLAVATADCLPVVMYDPAHQVIGIAHAGWRGTLGGIVLRMADDMCRVGNGDTKDFLVWFGPSAKACCYEVDQHFYQKVQESPEGKASSLFQGNAWWFSSFHYNRLLLLKAGIPRSSFHEDQSICTICSPRHCSYRRDGEKSERQMTIVVLGR